MIRQMLEGSHVEENPFLVYEETKRPFGQFRQRGRRSTCDFRNSDRYLPHPQNEGCFTSPGSMFEDGGRDSYGMNMYSRNYGGGLFCHFNDLIESVSFSSLFSCAIFFYIVYKIVKYSTDYYQGFRARN